MKKYSYKPGDEPSSIFSDFLKSFLEGVASETGEFVIEEALGALFGGSQDPTNPQLAVISSQIQSLTSVVHNLSTQSKYQSTFMDVTGQIQNVANMISQSPDAILAQQWSDIVTFLTPGTGAVTETDYWSCINNLLNQGVGISLSNFTPDGKPVGFGNQSTSITGTLYETTVSGNPYGIYDIHQPYYNFGSEVFTLIGLVASNAYQCFQLVSNNLPLIVSIGTGYPNLSQTNLNDLIQNPEISSQVGDAQADSFITTLISSSFANAPQAFTGIAYDYYVALSNNTTVPSIMYTALFGNSIQTGDDYSNFYSGCNWFYPQYNNSGQNNEAFDIGFVGGNNLQNIVTINGGALTIVDIRFEFSDSTTVIITSCLVPPDDDFYSANCEQWLMNTMYTSQYGWVFNFINQGASQQNMALANDGNNPIDSIPSNASYNPSDPNQYWVLQMSS